MAGSVVAVAVVIHPILKRSSEGLAVGCLSARIVEGIVLAITGIAWQALMSLGNEFVQVGQPAETHYQTLGNLVLATPQVRCIMKPAR